MNRARLLIITEQGDISKEYDLFEENMTIGRSPQSDIVINNSDISRSHAQILKMNNAFFISDLGSTNGTCLNGVNLEPKQIFELKSNDQITLGHISLLFQIVSISMPTAKEDSSTVRFSRNFSEHKEPIYIPKAENLSIEFPNKTTALPVLYKSNKNNLHEVQEIEDNLFRDFKFEEKSNQESNTKNISPQSPQSKSILEEKYILLAKRVAFPVCIVSLSSIIAAIVYFNNAGVFG